MRIRDAVIIGISLTALLWSLDWGTTTNLELALVRHYDTSGYRDPHRPSKSELLPPPLIADLDGDGLYEVVTVTPDFLVQILAVEQQQQSSSKAQRQNNGYYSTKSGKGADEISLKHEASLLSGAHRVTVGRRPVALASGYVDAISASDLSSQTSNLHSRAEYERNANKGQKREQVIVVLTEAWTVLCFDAKLKLLWESNIDHDQKSGESSYYHREASILINAVPLHVNDRGSVVIGGRMVVDDSKPQKSGKGLHDHAAPVDEEIAPSLRRARLGELESAESEDHFVYFILEGGSGKLRWKHDAHAFFGGDAHDSESMRETLLPQHNHALHVLSHTHTKHIGEMPWQEFRSSLWPHLNHRWSFPSDTVFTLAHLEKEHKIGNSNTHRSDAPHNEWGAILPLLHRPGLSHGGMVPHSATDHLVKPNAIVSHHETGIEVVHLYTGRTLCSLTFSKSSPYSVFSDINGDDVIDQIYVLDAVHSHISSPDMINRFMAAGSLTFIAETTDESRLHLWNVTLKGVSRLESFIFRNPTSILGAFANKKASAPLQTTTPLIVPSSWRLSAAQQSSDKLAERDCVFLLSDGRILSVRGRSGAQNWIVKTSSTVRVRSSHTSHSIDNSPDHIKNDGPAHETHLSLHLFSQLNFGHPDSLLAIGDSLTVLSLAGSILAETPTLDQPIMAPIFGDWNNDGFTDILLVTADSICAFQVRSSSSSLLLPTLILLFMFCIVIITLSRLQEPKLPPSPSSFVNNSRVFIGSPLHRATD